jgi:hypothetical protein
VEVTGITPLEDATPCASKVTLTDSEPLNPSVTDAGAGPAGVPTLVSVRLPETEKIIDEGGGDKDLLFVSQSPRKIP